MTLGVVLDADATLRFPDFRAEERTFALIAQLAGRVGRGGDGRVLVQTIAPEARSIVHAARHDSDGFVAGELERRRALCYPPFSHLSGSSARRSSPRCARCRRRAARCVARIEVRRQPRRTACRPTQRVPATGIDYGRATGPAPAAAAVLGPAPLFRLRGRERQVLVVKASERRAAVQAVGEAVQPVAAPVSMRACSFSVDVDPQ